MEGYCGHWEAKSVKCPPRNGVGWKSSGHRYTRVARCAGLNRLAGTRAYCKVVRDIVPQVHELGKFRVNHGE